MEQNDFNLLFCRFVGHTLEEPIWYPTTFPYNRDRLLIPLVADQIFLVIRAQADAARLLSRDLFTVAGILIDAASLKSFRPKEENGSSKSGVKIAIDNNLSDPVGFAATNVACKISSCTRFGGFLFF